MLRLLGVRGAVHVTLMVGHLCPGWSERVFGVESIALVYDDTGGVSLLDAGAVTA
jgi:hypothetical protein